MAPQNKAAFYPSDKASSLEVGPSPYPTVGANELIVKVGTVAINPIDWTIQNVGRDVFPFLQYPLAGGLDVSGTVVEVGAGVEGSFKPGDRVIAFSYEFSSRSGGFQHYVAVPASLTVRITDSLSFDDAAVLPSGITTAAVALYQSLGLDLPATTTTTTTPTRPGDGEKVVLISGGATSVGSNAIQLAVASGYTVYTTSSPANFAHCLSLGASLVFDYHSASVAQDLKDAFKGKECVGGLSTTEGSNALVFDVVGASSSRNEQAKKKVASTLLFNTHSVPGDISAEMVHAYWIKDNAPLLNAIYGKFLPEALASGKYQCAPKPVVIGQGLAAIQAALDRGKAGAVSCQKLVVSLEGEV